MSLLVKKFLLTLGDWRYWHHHVKYVPLSPVWLWYCLRSGTPWFFTAANPTLTFGGFEGEGKKEMYNQLPEDSYPATFYLTPLLSFEEIETTVKNNGFAYPFVVKPDVGMMGFMFRKISNAAQLKAYHEVIGVEYLVQKLIHFPLELSIFYYRIPGEEQGKISGFIQKEPPYIIGDGVSSLQILIKDHKNPFLKTEKLLQKFTNTLSTIIAPGEKMYLSNASNRTQGGSFKDLQKQVDAQLLHFFDDLSHKGEFYYGRYDILCNSVEDLKNSGNFSILEFNGAGAGTQHIFTDRFNFWQSEKEVLHHWRMLYLIAKENRKRGIPKWGFMAGLKHLKGAKKNLMYLLRTDESFPVY